LAEKSAEIIGYLIVMGEVDGLQEDLRLKFGEESTQGAQF